MMRAYTQTRRTWVIVADARRREVEVRPRDLYMEVGGVGSTDGKKILRYVVPLGSLAERARCLGELLQRMERCTCWRMGLAPATNISLLYLAIYLLPQDV